MDPMATQPLDSGQILMAQLGRIEKSIESLPGLLVRLDILTDSNHQLEVALRETNREITTRASEQQKAIEELRLRQSETMAAVAAISASLQEMRSDLPRRVDAVEEKHKVEREKQANQLQDFDDELDEWRPWLKGLKWGMTVIGGIVVTAFVVALIWALIQSGGKLP